MPFEVGKIIEGKVTGVTSFGAFMALEDGKTGLVHISEIANDYVKEIGDHIKVGDVVKVKVLSVDAGGKISLSIKKAIEPVRKPVVEKGGFDNMLADFLATSAEKMRDANRKSDSRRGKKV